MRCVSVALLLTGAVASGAQVPGAQWAGHDAVTFYLDFNEGTYAWKAAGNTYQFGSEFDLVDGGLAGPAWRNTTKMGYIGFDGLDNVPLEAGTVSLYLKSGEGNIFADGRAHGICSLIRTTGGMMAQRDLWPKQGLGLVLRKNEADRIELIAIAGGDRWQRFGEETVVAAVDASALDPATWHHLAFSWDFATRTVWLVVDGEQSEGAIPQVIERPYEYLAMILGNTHDYLAENQQPLEGLLDEVAILSAPWPQAQEIMAAEAPYDGPRPQAPAWQTPATLFPDDPELAHCEEVAREFLEVLVQTQRHGGWGLSIKWPSLLQWSAVFRMPEPRNMVWLSKDNHTAFGAAQLLFAYEALGDERYLQAARNTGEMYWATQDPELGAWVHGYYYENGGYVPDSSYPLIQDHVQTGPMMLLCYLHRVTGDERYLDAAKRNAEFLIRVQNPNGSWPHHWDPERGAGVTANGGEGGGEVNDYGTSGPITALLSMYRYTGDERYREAALRGADWLVAAFIDNGKVAGWAGQYDAQNRPVVARHFEPPAVTQYGARWAADGLFAAYAATRDERYLAPVRRAVEWFEANKVGDDGWWWDYDIETGRPISMYANEIYFLDDPAQVRALMARTGASEPPKPSNAVQFEALRGWLEQIEQQPNGRVLPPPTRQELAEYVTQYKARFAAEPHVLYPNRWPSGQGLTLVRYQTVRFCDLLMRARAVRGDIPVENPLFRRIDAFVGWNKVLLDYD
ncbi:MAG: pectate lyase [Armatimonadota bacterium]